MTRGGKFKPKRGGPRRFTSSRNPDAYVHTRQSDESGEEEEGVEVSSEVEQVEEGKVNSSSESENEHESEQKGKSDSVNNLNKDMDKLKMNTPKAPRELSRREREALEKERARQHYLKMKEQEDAARLAVIRKRREEEAARHAAEQKAKEEARFNRR